MIPRYNVVMLLAVFLIAVSTGMVSGGEDFSKVYGKVNQAVVLIDFEDRAREVGSGVIIGITVDGIALILTANHVVQGYEEVLVSFAGILGQQYKGMVSQTLFDETDDLAIIEVLDPPSDLKIISFRKSVAKKGESVGTIGHPQEKAYTWTDGSITNIFGKYIMHDAELKVGSSGGPLLDRCGRMLGLNVELMQPPEEPLDNETQPTEDTPEVGTGVTIASGSIVSLMDGWLSEISLQEKWKFKKYCSFWERFYKDLRYIGTEVVIAGGIIYLIWPNGNGPDSIFEPPPDIP